jgi:hypothetical protein
MALTGVSMGAWYDFKEGRLLDDGSFSYGSLGWRIFAITVMIILSCAFLVAVFWSTYALGLWCLVIVLLHASAVLVTLVTSVEDNVPCRSVTAFIFRISLFLRERIPMLRTFHQMLLNNPLDVEGDPSTLHVDDDDNHPTSPKGGNGAKSANDGGASGTDSSSSKTKKALNFVPHIYLTDGCFIDNTALLPFVAEGSKKLQDVDIILSLDAEIHVPDAYEVLKSLLSSRNYGTRKSSNILQQAQEMDALAQQHERNRAPRMLGSTRDLFTEEKSPELVRLASTSAAVPSVLDQPVLAGAVARACAVHATSWVLTTMCVAAQWTPSTCRTSSR